VGRERGCPSPSQPKEYEGTENVKTGGFLGNCYHLNLLFVLHALTIHGLFFVHRATTLASSSEVRTQRYPTTNQVPVIDSDHIQISPWDDLRPRARQECKSIYFFLEVSLEAAQRWLQRTISPAGRFQPWGVWECCRMKYVVSYCCCCVSPDSACEICVPHSLRLDR
jgi:hypothetical protein